MFKRGPFVSWVKIVCARITSTRFTTLYFLLAILTCLALSALQALALVDNLKAASLLTPIERLPHVGFPIAEQGKLKLCPNLPSEGTGSCMEVINFQTGFVNRTLQLEDKLPPHRNNSSKLVVTAISNPACLVSLKWLDEVLNDNEREDVVTLVFNVYLFVLSFVTVINESTPHLVAAFLGHVMGTAWAGYRLSSTKTLMLRYKDFIVPLACGGLDVLRESLWNTRMQYTVPAIIVHVVTLLSFSYLSLVLLKVYRNQTFSRVGAAPKIHTLYKVVLVFFVCLQIANFFCLASTTLWLNKIWRSPVTRFSGRFALDHAGSILTLVIHVSWFFLGWFSIRKESRIKFAIFITIAVIHFATSTALFANSLYRYTFRTWPFFTTVTCTGYILQVATSVLSIMCRLNFGKGLAHYFHVTQVLEGIDFTPVYFSKTEEAPKEKSQFLDFEKVNGTLLSPLPPAYHIGNAKRTSWMFSTHTVQVSTTPPLLSDLGPVPARLSGGPVLGK